MRKALRWRNWKEKRGERERSCRRLCDEQISERENLKEEEEEEEEGEEEDKSGKRESEQEEEEEEGMIWYRVEVMQGKCRINRSGLLSPAEICIPDSNMELNSSEHGTCGAADN